MLGNMFKIIIIIFLLQINPVTSNAVEPDEILNNKKQELRAREISQNIRCMICQNQSIDDSSSSIARDLRILIRSKIEEGSEDKEIYKFLSERYGDFILLKPALKNNTIALWILPFVLFIIGILVIITHNRKSNNFIKRS